MRGWLSSPLRVGGALAFLLVVAFVILLRPSGELPWTTGKYLLMPDIAHPVAPLVHVQDSKPAIGGGALFFVDVQESQASELDVLFPWLHPHSTLVPAAELVPPGSSSQAFARTELRQMATSQRTAAAVALRYLGYHVVIHYNGVLVDQIVLGTDAAGKLQPNDVIVSVNGHPTLTKAALLAFMGSVKPGKTVVLSVRRGKTLKTVPIRTTNVHGYALIGIVPDQSFQIVSLPLEVRIDSGDIGGPSAGLAFTLEVMRRLGRDVTHGYRVAATGTIDIEGAVGAIGGIEQKTYGAREAGAQVFLVPAGQNARQARKFAGPDLKIIPVTSLAQALRELAALH